MSFLLDSILSIGKAEAVVAVSGLIPCFMEQFIMW